ncbi:bpX5 domain-containing protein [Chromobacterium phragmitis]|uniref:bpX5 domain-containing protein n=1 Tax=Chromobacterium phragmitis TaxID=2202141 RepID=UPI0038783339
MEGVEYARPDASIRQLWLPTKWQPDVSTDALSIALNARAPAWPMLLWREPALIIPLNRQLPAGDELLADIRRRWSGACRS